MICIVNDYYKEEIERQLKNKGYRMTELASTGGFLKKGSTTFLFGVLEDDIAELKGSIKKACLDVEKIKGKKRSSESRLTSFVVNATQVAPFLNKLD
ncbi:cyclic-di-AMP receptor [Bacillus sp. FJAT-45350]|uniref:cyclic-di-AMP receptor n=1 Tax=Bacillus sp. FJAT-45350 TaxID=2011014 RepID=UPI0027BA4DDA|nr:cyclic-di-AMP receptor [Bacillus sp. FJAT-45350]